MSSSDDDDPVGYKKPPKHAQFKKGQSGNPSGRPKGSKNLKSVVAAALLSKVWVNEGGKRVQRSKLEILVTQAINKAATGDPRAIDIAILHLAPLLDENGTTGAPLFDLQADKQMVLSTLARLNKGGTHEE